MTIAFRIIIAGMILIMGMFLYHNAQWMAVEDDTPRTSYRLALWTSWTMFTDPGTQTGAGNDARERVRGTAVLSVQIRSHLSLKVSLVGRQQRGLLLFPVRVARSGR